ncbi:MAG TPA: tRNA lysidine(34) synthetase TilS [Syntrophomonadaceae bacterium]|nr:tRNA lysidine(34) synthetase TilS [Syntrophomonadaceae bacterium]
MINRVQQYILANEMILPGERVIVAVSGGPDSMVLLHILHRLSSSLSCELIAAHLNHQLRPEADDEQSFVETVCQEWNLPCYSHKVDIAARAAEQKRNIEELGREERYQFFDTLAARLAADKIATAHHEDDQAETVLMNMIRGTGIKGLRGILPVQGKVIRPLLSISKNDILSYAEENGLAYCTDASNQDPSFLRNRIRHHLLPSLQKDYNPQMVRSLSNLAHIALHENAWMEEETDRCWLAVLREQQPHMISLDLQEVAGLHPALQHRIFLRALSILTGEEGWGWQDVDQIVDLSSRPGSSRRLELKKQLRVFKSYDTMIFTTVEPVVQDFCYEIKVPDFIYIEEIKQGFELSIINVEAMKPEPGHIYLDYDKLEPPLFIRSRRDGDRFHPVGMQGSKKLKKLFIDLKIPFLKRDQIPLLTTRKGLVYAVVGYGISRLAMVDKESKRILVIKPAGVVKNNSSQPLSG